ncbi:hypothetical protein BX661DRAFT_187659 [Kickxella alabastrina]|uniref:uncharacterized protein n=1 Tax=Kickxella alabastrina TaxID=61397 RepID=UPI00221EF608|nr:uncharacterized protein BX661DRAFT_187659 [Kickxella alabastrina]KAI7822306.1 hypothetical protein BX661DRAFT_187659 [Kickxella alabastrina]
MQEIYSRCECLLWDFLLLSIHAFTFLQFVHCDIQATIIIISTTAPIIYSNTAKQQQHQLDKT